MLRSATLSLSQLALTALLLSAVPALAQQPLPTQPAPGKGTPTSKTKAAPPKAEGGAPAATGSESGLRQRVEQLEEQLVDMNVVIGTLEIAGEVGRRSSSRTACPGWRRQHGRERCCPSRRHRNPNSSADLSGRATRRADAHRQPRAAPLGCWRRLSSVDHGRAKRHGSRASRRWLRYDGCHRADRRPDRQPDRGRHAARGGNATSAGRWRYAGRRHRCSHCSAKRQHGRRGWQP